MSKAKKVPAPETVPLSDITITWHRQAHFSDEERKPIVITGRQLGQVLSWLARTRSGAIGQNANTTDVWDPGSVGLSLEGLAEELKALSTAEGYSDPSMVVPILAELGDRVDDMAARLSAVENAETEAKTATVIIARREQAVV